MAWGGGDRDREAEAVRRQLTGQSRAPHKRHRMS